MVVQKPVRVVPKAKFRKTLKASSSNSEEVNPLAGSREAVALEILHTMFMKKLAQESNFVAFQKKKNFVEKQSLKQGVDMIKAQCVETSEETSDSEASDN